MASETRCDGTAAGVRCFLELDHSGPHFYTSRTAAILPPPPDPRRIAFDVDAMDAAEDMLDAWPELAPDDEDKWYPLRDAIATAISDVRARVELTPCRCGAVVVDSVTDKCPHCGGELSPISHAAPRGTYVLDGEVHRGK